MVTFKYQKDEKPIALQPRWSLASLADARSRGFYDLPFHKIKTVIVNLHAPNLKKTAEIFFLWRNVTDLVTLFKDATVFKEEPLFKGENQIQDLTVRLQKGLDGDWFNMSLGPNASTYFQRKNHRRDYDVAFLPFCTLRTVKHIYIEVHSKELEVEIDWEIINQGMEIVWKRSWERVPSPSDDGIAGNDVDRAVAADYFSMHIDLWLSPEEPEADLARRDFLSTWFDQGSNGNSEFEKTVLQIVEDYPEIIQAYDPQMEILEEMHFVLVSLYHYVKLLHGNLKKPEYWDQEIWKSTFPEGIPASYSSENWRISHLKFVYGKIYEAYMDKENFLSNMDYIIGVWEHKHPEDEDEDEDDLSLSLCVSCERCPDYDSELDELGYYDWLR